MKAVIFDMDGVIADSIIPHLESEQKILQRYGVNLSFKEMLGRYNGTTSKFMFNDWIKRYNLNTTAEKLASEKDKLFFEFLGNIPAVNGVVELIDSLKKQNIKMAVASSSKKKVVDSILKQIGILSYFDSVVTGDDVINCKPNPEIFLKAAKSIGIDPNDCIVIEDAPFGVQAAKTAGMKCIGYKNPNNPDKNIDLSKADIIISDFSKLSFEQMYSLFNKTK